MVAVTQNQGFTMAFSVCTLTNLIETLCFQLKRASEKRNTKNIKRVGNVHAIEVE